MPAQLAVERGDRFHAFAERTFRLFRESQQSISGGRKPNARAAAFEKRRSHFALKGLDVLGDSWLGNVESFRRPPETVVARYFTEYTEAKAFQHQRQGRALSATRRARAFENTVFVVLAGR